MFLAPIFSGFRTTLRLQFEYISEGILVNYRFEKKDDKWIITNSMIMEL